MVEKYRVEKFLLALMLNLSGVEAWGLNVKNTLFAKMGLTVCLSFFYSIIYISRLPCPIGRYPTRD